MDFYKLLRVALITPYYLQSTRGNAVTVRRVDYYLRKLGCVTEVFSLDALSPESLKKAVHKFSPDILHAFHGIRSGAVAAEISIKSGLPYVITITGTELCRGDDTVFTDEERMPLENAAALVAFHEVIGNRIASALPALTDKLIIIPQGVEAPELISTASLPESPFLFLLPAGIRPVKNILFCFKPLEQLWQKYPHIRLLLAGPVLDGSYFEEVVAAMARHPFASWLGDVPNTAMPSLYSSAHVILNTSLSEGGMANSILEGMAYGKPVLVSAVEGNRSLVTDNENGFLFSSEEDFVDKAERLLLDKESRNRIAEAGRSYVLEHCSAEKEAARYIELYLNAVEISKGD